MVQHVADRVAVMYLGGIVETGPTKDVFADPRHPYTRALLSAAPVARWGVKRTRTRLSGEISSAIDPPDACRLVGRCPLARPACSVGKPPLIDIGDGRVRRLSRGRRRSPLSSSRHPDCVGTRGTPLQANRYLNDGSCSKAF